MNFGPYVAFNTTTVNGVQYDRKELGSLVAAVVEADLNRRGLKVRLEVDKTVMFGNYKGHKGMSSTAMLVGLSQTLDLDYHSDRKSTAEGDPTARVTVMIGRTKTNSTAGGFSTMYQVKRTDDIDSRYLGFTYSVSAQKEGNTGSSDRSGLAAQVGYEVETIGQIKVGGEVGPYIAQDNINKGLQNGLLITLFWQKALNGDFYVRVEFERAANFQGHATDSDHLKMGVGKKF